MIGERSGRAALLACAAFAVLCLVAGASPAAAKKAKAKTVTRTFSQCQNVALPLTDHSVAQVHFTVPKPPERAKPPNGRVIGVTSAAVRVTHGYAQDISIFAISPAGFVVPLSLGRGDSTDDYGTGAKACSGSLTIFSDSSVTPIADSTPPFAGSFRPEAPMAGFVGAPASGIWTLLFSDDQTLDSGTVHAASLTFTYSYKKPSKKKA
ncbi:MAG TPA: proprotein convertase P-domain-containing protein [Gaiellaceae bacterium]|nr:proprotein convertase P-domain-containing protein [Gaiellaceae bacterium]